MPPSADLREPTPSKPFRAPGLDDPTEVVPPRVSTVAPTIQRPAGRRHRQFAAGVLTGLAAAGLTVAVLIPTGVIGSSEAGAARPIRAPIAVTLPATVAGSYLISSGSSSSAGDQLTIDANNTLRATRAFAAPSVVGAYAADADSSTIGFTLTATTVRLPGLRVSYTDSQSVAVPQYTVESFGKTTCIIDNGYQPENEPVDLTERRVVSCQRVSDTLSVQLTDLSYDYVSDVDNAVRIVDTAYAAMS